MKRPTTTVFALILWPAANDGFIIQTSQHIQLNHNRKYHFDSRPSISRIQHHWNSRRDGDGGLQPRRHEPTSRLFAAEAPSSGGESKITSAKVQEMASFLAIQLLERTLKAGLETQDKEEMTSSSQPTVADKNTSKKDDDDFESLFEDKEPTTPTEATTKTKSVGEELDSSSDPLVEAKEADPTIQSADDLEAATLDEVYDLEEDKKVVDSSSSDEGSGEKNVDEVASSPPPPLEEKSDSTVSSVEEASPTDLEESTIAAVLGEDLMPDIISKDFGKPLDVLKSSVPPLRESSIPKKKPIPLSSSEEEEPSSSGSIGSSSSEETIQTSDNEYPESSDTANIETASQETGKEDEGDKETSGSEVKTEKIDNGDNEDEMTMKIKAIKKKQETARQEMLSSRLISEKRTRIKQKALDESLKEAEAEEAALEAAIKIEEEARLAEEEKTAEEARVKALEEERAAQEKKEAEEAARLKALDEAKQKAIEKKEARLKFEEDLKLKAEEKFLEIKAKEGSRKMETEQTEDSRAKENKESEQDATEEEKLLNDEIERVAEAAESMAEDGESGAPGQPDAAKRPKGKFVGKFLSRISNLLFRFRRRPQDNNQLTNNVVTPADAAAGNYNNSVPSSIANRRAAETIQALKQPKSADEEKQLQEKYADMDVGDRAFAILKDLGMIDVSPDPKDPNYDDSKDDEDCDQFWLWG